jgi:glycolate oxidase FAD binding subunit
MQSFLPADRIVGGDALTPDWRQRIEAALDPQPTSMDLPGLLLPQTQADCAEIVACSHQQGWSLLPCGQGTKLSWGNPVGPIHWVISTQGLNRLIEHAASDLTVTVEAGMTLKQLQQILAQAGQCWPVDPLYAEHATVGGIIATADTGSWRHRYGGIRDLVLGVTLVRADGQLAKAGGRVVKNVAGYDLMKVMTGSYGSLGILTQVTLRLYPLPQAQRRVLLTGSLADIDKLRRDLLDSSLIPVGIDLVSPSLLAQLPGTTPAGEGEAGLAVEFHGSTPAVATQVQRLQQMAVPLSQIDVEDGSSFQATLQALLGPSDQPTLLIKLGCLPNHVCQLQQTIGQRWPTSLLQIHVGSGIGRWRLPASDLSSADLLALRDQLNTQGGFLTILEAPTELKQQIDVWGYAGNASRLHCKIRQQFDPQQVLSPGRFFA